MRRHDIRGGFHAAKSLRGGQGGEMDSAFFSDLLASIAERGRSVLKLTAWPRDGENRTGSLIDMCGALLTGRGEASGVALASEILARYRSLSEADKSALFGALANGFGSDPKRVEDAVARFVATGDELAASDIHYATEPRRQELFRRLNRAPGGTAALVAMRADLLESAREDRSLDVVDRDFQHLFASWFNRGFLVLRRIDWSSPGGDPGKDHSLRGGARDPRLGRFAPTHRSGGSALLCLFPPRAVDEPLIFVEVALTLAAPDAIAPLLAEKRADVAKDQARVATFYSISNCQRGLSSVTFGNFLIKQVVEEIRRELPRIETFVTLSPVPGLRAWIETNEDPAVEPLVRQARERGRDERWASDAESAERMRRVLEPLAAYYFLKARRPDGRVMDSVARFHLGNGARLERINWMGDLSVKGLFESYGVMVNYRYDLAEIERNHETYANQGVAVASSAVKRMLPSGRTLGAAAPALPAPEGRESA